MIVAEKQNLMSDAGLSSALANYQIPIEIRSEEPIFIFKMLFCTNSKLESG